MHRVRRALVALVAVGSIAACGGSSSSTAPATGPRRSAGTTAVPAAPALLAWPPPALGNPQTIVVTDEHRELELDVNLDYRISLPPNAAQPAPLRASGGLVVRGGHDIVIVGGHIEIGPQDIPEWGEQGSDANIRGINMRRAMFFDGATGVVHVEGVLMNGADISEGIQLNTPDAIVQLQNIRIENLHARDQRDFTDNHPDLVDPWGGVRELRVDHLTGETDYQGFKLAGTRRPVGRAVLRHVNIRGLPTARFLVWGSDNLVYRDLWIRPGRGRSRQSSLYPPGDERFDGVEIGTPPGGDFVPADVVGATYVSPGYE